MENKNNVNCLNYEYENENSNTRSTYYTCSTYIGFLQRKFANVHNYSDCYNTTIRPVDGHLMDLRIYLHTFPNIVRRQILTGSLSLYLLANGLPSIASTGYKLL